MEGDVTIVHILIVEDDSELNRFVCSHLDNSGFITKGCLNTRDAYDEMYSMLYDLIISDIMMPEIDEFKFTRAVRQANKTIPILFMFAKDDLNSRQEGSQSGIDDYMVKPIEAEELLLRAYALLRRASIEVERKIAIGNLTLGADAVIAVMGGTELPATAKEFNILYKLLSYPSKTFSRGQPMDELWELENDIGLRAVDVYITGIRKKFLAYDGFSLKTIRGLGYKAVLQ